MVISNGSRREKKEKYCETTLEIIILITVVVVAQRDYDLH